MCSGERPSESRWVKLLLLELSHCATSFGLRRLDASWSFQISGCSVSLLEIGIILGMSRTGKGSGSGLKSDTSGPFTSEEPKGASTTAASLLCSRRRRLLTPASKNPVTRAGSTPAEMATARRLEAITPESQNQ